MADQGYPSKRRRGGDQRRQKAPSSSQAPQATRASQALHPIIPQDPEGYTEPPQELLAPELWGNFAGESMEWQPDGSQKLGSPAMSYVNISTPSGGITDSYGMVHSKSSGAYSNGSGSIQMSDESEHGQQAFYSPPWTPGAGCGIERETPQNLQHPTSFQDQDLLHLGTQKPRPVYNPYQQHFPSSREYEDFPHYTYQPPIESLHTQTQPGSSPPWNQIEHRVPRYDGSIAAFELSPGPAGTPEALQRLLTDSPSCKSKNSHSHKKESSRSLKVEPGRKDKSVSPGWEHIVVKKGGCEIVSERIDESRHSSGGRRKGKLAEEVKKKAARVRKAKACWNCWLAKVPCSEGEVCERCLKHCSKRFFQLPGAPLADQLCSRSGFSDFEPSLFPDFLHSHFSKAAIESLLKEHSRGFKDDSMKVYVTTGSVFMPLGIEVHFFKPRGDFESELVKQHHLTTASEMNQSRMVCRYSAPVGIMELYTPELKKVLKQHIEDMLANPKYAAQTTAGDVNTLSQNILDFVIKYQKTTKSTLVYNALMLHAIHYYMGTLITFTTVTALSVYAQCDHLSVPPNLFLSSRLLNRQLKFAMHRLHRELTRSVLHELEKSLRSRTKDAWGPSFATNLVLGMCVEGLQTAADTFVVCDVKKEGQRSELRREMSWEACKEVEEAMWGKCTGLFHDIYRSGKMGNGGAREPGFNPFRVVAEGVESTLELDTPTEELVRDVYSLVFDDRKALQELSQRPAIIHWGYDVVAMDPNDIRINNTGRLTAKFLMSFFA